MKLTDTIKTEYADISQTEISELKKNKNASALEEIYEMWLDEFKQIENMQYDPDIQNSSARGMILASKIQYSPLDITHLSLIIDEGKEERDYLHKFSGSFFSTLINMHYKKTKTTEVYTLFTTGSATNEKTGLDFIGFQNDGATILVKGDVGENLADQMHSGKIIIEGKVGGEIGLNMTFGHIEIQNGCTYLRVDSDIEKKAFRDVYISITGEIDELEYSPNARGHKIILNGKKLNFT